MISLDPYSKYFEYCSCTSENNIQNTAQDTVLEEIRKAETHSLDEIIHSDINKLGELSKYLEIYEATKIMMQPHIAITKD